MFCTEHVLDHIAQAEEEVEAQAQAVEEEEEAPMEVDGGEAVVAEATTSASMEERRGGSDAGIVRRVLLVSALSAHQLDGVRRLTAGADAELVTVFSRAVTHVVMDSEQGAIKVRVYVTHSDRGSASVRVSSLRLLCVSRCRFSCESGPECVCVWSLRLRLRVTHDLGT